jgi:hypothetical protein
MHFQENCNKRNAPRDNGSGEMAIIIFSCLPVMPPTLGSLASLPLLLRIKFVNRSTLTGRVSPDNLLTMTTCDLISSQPSPVAFLHSQCGELEKPIAVVFSWETGLPAAWLKSAPLCSRPICPTPQKKFICPGSMKKHLSRIDGAAAEDLTKLLYPGDYKRFWGSSPRSYLEVSIACHARATPRFASDTVLYTLASGELKKQNAPSNVA